MFCKMALLRSDLLFFYSWTNIKWRPLSSEHFDDRPFVLVQELEEKHNKAGAVAVREAEKYMDDLFS